MKIALTPLQRTIQIYRARGFNVRTGLSPWHFKCNSYNNLPLSSIFKGDSKLSTGGGISLTEMFFFESLCSTLNPKRILIIGNAFGLSSIYLALLNPQATVVAIDASVEGLDNDTGNQITRQIAQEEDLQLEVIHGFSPQDVPRIVEGRLNGGLDLVFIDGLHTNHQQELDFDACYRFGRDHAVYCLHDVLNFKMMHSFEKISKRHPQLKKTILWRTPSGMGILYPSQVNPEVEESIHLFTEPAWMVEKTKKEVARERFMRMSGAFLIRGTPAAMAVRKILQKLPGRYKTPKGT